MKLEVAIRTRKKNNFKIRGIESDWGVVFCVGQSKKVPLMWWPSCGDQKGAREQDAWCLGKSILERENSKYKFKDLVYKHASKM